MREQNIKTAGDAEHFMAGVALFDELLREAERIGLGSESDSMILRSDCRCDFQLNLFALRFIDRLAMRPELARGFSAALGDYVGMLQVGLAPAAGDQYTHLTFEDCIAHVPAADDGLTASNVVSITSGRRGVSAEADHA